MRGRDRSAAAGPVLGEAARSALGAGLLRRGRDLRGRPAVPDLVQPGARTQDRPASRPPQGARGHAGGAGEQRRAARVGRARRGPAHRCRGRRVRGFAGRGRVAVGAVVAGRGRQLPPSRPGALVGGSPGWQGRHAGAGTRHGARRRRGGVRMGLRRGARAEVRQEPDPLGRRGRRRRAAGPRRCRDPARARRRPRMGRSWPIPRATSSARSSDRPSRRASRHIRWRAERVGATGQAHPAGLSRVGARTPWRRSSVRGKPSGA